MKEQVLLYGVCAAISVAAVAVTSVIKLVACAIAKKAGKDISGNVKEYVFTPMAIILAALGLYIWLEKFMHVENEAQFVLIVLCFSFATMVIYWLIFQPTRKLALAVIHAIAKKANAEPVLDVVESVAGQTDAALQANANQGGAAEKPSAENTASEGKQISESTEAAEKPPADADESPSSASPETIIAETAADKLKAMVDAIKKK